MDAMIQDRELAETMIILTGSAAYDAAVRFASDCRDRGNEVLADLWERVVASILALKRGAEPAVEVAAPAKAEPAEPAVRRCRFVHYAYDFVANLPKPGRTAPKPDEN
jgi:hypothetical protein